MQKVPYTNSTKKIVHVGNVTIFPGDTREVDPTLLPGHKAKQPAEQLDVNPILALLDGSVKQIADALSGISAEDLDALELAEEAGKTRKGVLEAIAEERLSRADAAQEAEEFVAELTAMSDEDLDAAVDMYQEDAGKLALVEAEIARRAGGDN